MSLAEVGSGLSVLYAVKDEPNPAGELVVAGSEPQFCVASSFSGRFYSCLQFFSFDSTPHSEKVVQAARRLQASVKELLQEMRRLDECMAMWRASEKKDEEATLFRRQILALGSDLSALMNLVDPLYFETRLFTIQRVFSRLFNAPLFTSEEIAECEHFQNNLALVTLEGIIQRAVPYSILQQQLDKRAVLSPREQDDIDDFVGEVEKNRYKMTPYLLHRTFLGVAGEDPEKLGFLESHLFQKKLDFIKNGDPLYTAWLRRLKPGMVLGAYTLGNDEGDALPVIRNLGFDLFSLQGQPDRMMLIGRGVATVSLWDAFMKRKLTLIQPPKVFEKDAGGRFIVIERLIGTVDKTPWIARSRDSRRMNATAASIRMLIEHKATPATFRADCLLITAEQRIVTMMPISPGTQNDFNVLYEFVRGAAQGNFSYLWALFAQSGLKAHPVAQFYLDIAKNHLSPQKDSLSVHDRAALRRNNDSTVPARAFRMLRELDQMVALLLRKHEARRVSEAQIKHALTRFHETHGISYTEVADMEHATSMLEGFF